MLACLKIISTLLEDPKSHPFREPVNAIALEIPEYFDVISRPMDLGTVRARLERGHYAVPDAFATDVRRVFTNCAMFNAQETLICNDGRALLSRFELMFTQLNEAVDLELSRKVAEAAALSRICDELAVECKQLVLTLSADTAAGGRGGGGAAASAAAAAARRAPRMPLDAEPMSLAERELLASLLKTLPAERMGIVVGMLVELHPALEAATRQREFVLDLDELPSSTLRCLERFVRVAADCG